MKRYINYLKYVLRHKWFVYQAGQFMGVSNRRLLMHDMSKFSIREFFAYAQCFYAEDGSKQYIESMNFDLAWNYHQKSNPHHWQYWVLLEDSGKVKPLPMPIDYIEEMVADWAGASKAINNNWEVREWYEKSRHRMTLHPSTIEYIDILLKRLDLWKTLG